MVKLEVSQFFVANESARSDKLYPSDKGRTFYEFCIYKSYYSTTVFFYVCCPGYLWVRTGSDSEDCESDPWSDLYADYFLAY
jgi:hypothetical protein